MGGVGAAGGSGVAVVGSAGGAGGVNAWATILGPVASGSADVLQVQAIALAKIKRASVGL
ncbi:MAG TPA: hypothetical protein VMJ52_15480 [Xanthobacteraceae bacterium]|nr:hypothetical protein [Xanthobacteraceae bacterium]